MNIILKKWLCFILIYFTCNVLFAKNYQCIGDQDFPIVKISIEKDGSEFGYLTKNKSFNFDLYSNYISYSYGEHGEIYIKLDFNGESTVKLYGRISMQGESVFDIYASGMIFSGVVVAETLVGYTCSESLAMNDIVGTYKFKWNEHAVWEHTVTISDSGEVSSSEENTRSPDKNSRKDCRGQAMVNHRIITLFMECTKGGRVTHEDLTINLEDVFGAELTPLTSFHAPVRRSIQGKFLEDITTMGFQKQL